MKINIFNDECLKVMDKLIEQGVTVDAIITDPPYGTTACSWDSIIPFEKMWERLEKLIKPTGAIVLFGSQPFTGKIINSNFKNFRYEWIWEKSRSTNFLNAKKMPLKKHENILVFYKKLCTYNPQNLIEINKPIKAGTKKSGVYNKTTFDNYIKTHTNYPNSILKFDSVSKGIHPTQKPVELLEYLIKTYSNENETILDFTAGSFTCGVACINTKRNFIGIELDINYFEKGLQRMKNLLSTAEIIINK